MNSQRWQQIKALRILPRLVHVSKKIITVEAGDGTGRLVNVVSPERGITLNLGRNSAKRALRAGKPRKHWPVLARAR